jgi:hypothetical protein
MIITRFLLPLVLRTGVSKSLPVGRTRTTSRPDKVVLSALAWRGPKVRNFERSTLSEPGSLDQITTMELLCDCRSLASRSNYFNRSVGTLVYRLDDLRSGSIRNLELARREESTRLGDSLSRIWQ